MIKQVKTKDYEFKLKDEGICSWVITNVTMEDNKSIRKNKAYHVCEYDGIVRLDISELFTLKG